MTNTATDAQMFDLAPIPMWLEDYSGIRAIFDRWRSEGVEDIRAYLLEDLSRIAECSRTIRVLDVNRKTLELYGARDMDHLVANLDAVFRDDMLTSHIDELEQLWEGNSKFSSNAVNYTLTGQRLDIQLSATIMPGHEEKMDRILVTTENVTEREEARRYAEGIFEHSPVSLWVEDFSGIKTLLDDIRDRGIVDLREFTDVHPEFVRQCMREIRVIKVNQATLDMFHAADYHTLLQNLPNIFRGEMLKHFREQLIELWNGNLLHRREVLNHTVDGDELHLLLQFSVFPGHETDWSLVQVSLTDITARKKAEAYLEYLGKHDVLTKLHNRAFYADELNRLEKKSLRPVSAIVIDMNGLKETNDELGHEAGDGLLRRLGEVLNQAVSLPNCAARIGGDEFVVLLPGGDQKAVDGVVENIHKLLNLNNQFYSLAPLGISLGSAVSRPGESMASVVQRADMAMYEEKQRYYDAKTNPAPGKHAAA